MENDSISVSLETSEKSREKNSMFLELGTKIYRDNILIKTITRENKDEPNDLKPGDVIRVPTRAKMVNAEKIQYAVTGDKRLDKAKMIRAHQLYAQGKTKKISDEKVDPENISGKKVTEIIFKEKKNEIPDNVPAELKQYIDAGTKYVREKVQFIPKNMDIEYSDYVQYIYDVQDGVGKLRDRPGFYQPDKWVFGNVPGKEWARGYFENGKWVTAKPIMLDDNRNKKERKEKDILELKIGQRTQIFERVAQKQLLSSVYGHDVDPRLRNFIKEFCIKTLLKVGVKPSYDDGPKIQEMINKTQKVLSWDEFYFRTIENAKNDMCRDFVLCVREFDDDLENTIEKYNKLYEKTLDPNVLLDAIETVIKPVLIFKNESKRAQILDEFQKRKDDYFHRMDNGFKLVNNFIKNIDEFINLETSRHIDPSQCGNIIQDLVIFRNEIANTMNILNGYFINNPVRTLQEDKFDEVLWRCTKVIKIEEQWKLDKGCLFKTISGQTYPLGELLAPYKSDLAMQGQIPFPTDRYEKFRNETFINADLSTINMQQLHQSLSSDFISKMLPQYMQFFSILSSNIQFELSKMSRKKSRDLDEIIADAIFQYINDASKETFKFKIYEMALMDRINRLSHCLSSNITDFQKSIFYILFPKWFEIINKNMDWISTRNEIKEMFSDPNLKNTNGEPRSELVKQLYEKYLQDEKQKTEELNKTILDKTIQDSLLSGFGYPSSNISKQIDIYEENIYNSSKINRNYDYVSRVISPFVYLDDYLIQHTKHFQSSLASNKINISNLQDIGIFAFPELFSKQSKSKDVFETIEILKDYLVQTILRAFYNKVSKTYIDVPAPPNITINISSLVQDVQTQCNMDIPPEEIVIDYLDNGEFKCYPLQEALNKIFSGNDSEFSEKFKTLMRHVYITDDSSILTRHLEIETKRKKETERKKEGDEKKIETRDVEEEAEKKRNEKKIETERKVQRNKKLKQFGYEFVYTDDQGKLWRTTLTPQQVEQRDSGLIIFPGQLTSRSERIIHDLDYYALPILEDLPRLKLKNLY